MSLETLLVLFVAVTALAFTVQCVAVWSASRSVRQLAERLEQRTSEVEGSLRLVQTRLVELTDDLQPLKLTADNLAQHVDEISGTIRERARDLDAFIEEVMGVGRDQVSKIDFLVTDTVQKFEQTTEVIQKDVLRPAVEISSFVKGVRAGLDVLLSRKERQPSAERPPEEELFIG